MSWLLERLLDQGPGLRPLLWGVPLCMTAHNAEEALGIGELIGPVERFPPRLAGVRRFVFLGGPRRFLIAAALLTLGTWAVAALATRGEAYDPLLGGILVAVQAGLLLNALVPHLLLSVWMRRYTPGVATALLLNVPFGIYLLHRALDAGAV